MISTFPRRDGARAEETAAKIRLALKKEGVRTRQAEIRMKSGKKTDPEQDLAQGSRAPQVRDLVAQDAGVGRGTVERFKYIEKNAPNLADDLCAGKKVNNKKPSIDGVYRDLRREERQTGLKATEFPSGSYRVIYADPRKKES